MMTPEQMATVDKAWRGGPCGGEAIVCPRAPTEVSLMQAWDGDED